MVGGFEVAFFDSFDVDNVGFHIYFNFYFRFLEKRREVPP